jgi:hypothetical protein
VRLTVIAQHIGLSIWLIVVLFSLGFTLFRINPPAIISPAVRLVYESTSPFQGYSPYTRGITVTATLADGTLQEVDVAEYFPYTRGSTVVRLHFWSFAYYGKQVVERNIERLAQRILQRERRLGAPIQQLTLTVTQWPLSLQGLFTHNTPSQTEVLFTTTVQ